MFLAEANPPPGLNGWLACLFYVLGGVLVVLKIFSHFKPAPSLPANSTLDVRVTTLEEEQRTMRETLHKHAAEFAVVRSEMRRECMIIEARLEKNNEHGEERANAIYERIERVESEMRALPERIIDLLAKTGVIHK